MRLLQHPSIFLARGLARSSRGVESGFARTLSLTTLSITLSLAVMLLAVSIILGFRGQVRSFAFSQTGHISLSGYGASWRDSNSPLYISDPFLQYLRHSPGVRSVMPLIQEAGLIKTEESFDGISLYGAASIALTSTSSCAKDACRSSRARSSPRSPSPRTWLVASATS